MKKRKIEKWEILGYVTAFFNPVPSGLLAGYFLYQEEKYRKTGKIVLAISAIITAIAIISTFLLL